MRLINSVILIFIHIFILYFFIYFLFFVISLNLWSLIDGYNFPEFHLFVTNGQIIYASSCIINQSITLHAFYQRNIKY